MANKHGIALVCTALTLLLLALVSCGGQPAPSPSPSPTAKPAPTTAAPTTAPPATSKPTATASPTPTATAKPSPTAAPAVKAVLVGTSGSAGTWFPVGSALGELVNKYGGIKVTCQTTAGAAENARLVSQKQVEIGFVSSDVLFQAMNGQGDFSAQKITNLRVLFQLNPSLTMLVVRADSAVKTVQELRGKKVAMGPKGSSSAMVAGYVLEAAGFDITKDLTVSNPAYNDMYDQLGDGVIDAFFLHGSPPVAGVTAIAAKKPVRCLAIEGAVRDAVTKKHPEFFGSTLKGGIYNGQPTDVPTTASALFWVTYDGFDANAAYVIVKSVLNNVRQADIAHPTIKDISIASALDGITTPLDPGARKYFEEIKHPKVAGIPQ